MTAHNFKDAGSQGLTQLVGKDFPRSEEHTSELQSRRKLVCRLLLEKKKTRFNCQTQPCFRFVDSKRGTQPLGRTHA